MNAKPFLKPGYYGVEVAADARRNEFDIKNQVIVQRETPVDTVFFGDSITHFWELNAYFAGAHGVVLNRGIGGDQTQYAVRRFEGDVLQLKPRRCVMLIGVNDAWDLEFDHWLRLEGMEYSFVLQRAKDNLRKMVEMALEAGIELYVCSVLPTDMDFTNREELRHDYILDVNAYLKTLCAEKGTNYVDYYSAMVAEDGRRVREGLMLEGLHPNVFGYDIMADTLKAAIRANGGDL